MKRHYKSAYQDRKRARLLREHNRERRHCVNENAQGTHGLATHGVRCAACHDVHRRTA